METEEKYYRQFLAAKALHYAINDDEARSESIRYFLRKIADKEKENKEIEFPQPVQNEYRRAA